MSTVSSDYNGYLTGASVLSSGWIKNHYWDGMQGTPYTVGGSDSTYTCNYFWANNTQVNYASHGGNAGDGSYCGAWFVALNGTAGVAIWYFAAAPSCKPLS